MLESDEKAVTTATATTSPVASYEHGFSEYIGSIAQLLGANSVASAHDMLKAELNELASILSCNSSDEEFFELKDFSRVIQGDELFFTKKQQKGSVNIKRIFDNPLDKSLLAPILLRNSLSYIEGLVKVIAMSIQQRTE